MQIAEIENEISFKDIMVKIIVYIGCNVNLLIFYLYDCQLDVQCGEEHIGSCLQDYFSKDSRIYFPKFEKGYLGTFHKFRPSSVNTFSKNSIQITKNMK